jgi:hypothetical protein
LVTIGDAFSIVAILGGICISAWALILGTALLFPQRAAIARDHLAGSPWRSFGVGLVLFVVLGTFSLIALGQPVPVGKLLGWTVLLGMLSVGVYGAAGMATLASERMRVLAGDMTPYVSLSKSAAVLVIAGLVPMLGWFLIVPVVTIFSLGAGAMALFGRAKQASFQI